jgi:transposase
MDTKVDVQYKDGGVSMKGVPQGRYTKEFREEAVKLIIQEGLSLPDAARRLSLPPSTLGNWVRALKEGKLAAIGATQKPLTDAESELARVRRELATVKMERDILKKAAAYFAKESLPGTRS